MGMNIRRGWWAKVRPAGFNGVDIEIRMSTQRAKNMIGKVVFGVDVWKPGNPFYDLIVLWKANASKQEGNM